MFDNVNLKPLIYTVLLTVSLILIRINFGMFIWLVHMIFLAYSFPLLICLYFVGLKFLILDFVLFIQYSMNELDKYETIINTFLDKFEFLLAGFFDSFVVLFFKLPFLPYLDRLLDILLQIVIDVFKFFFTLLDTLQSFFLQCCELTVFKYCRKCFIDLFNYIKTFFSSSIDHTDTSSFLLDDSSTVFSDFYLFLVTNLYLSQVLTILFLSLLLFFVFFVC